MVRFGMLEIRKTEICSESPARENANLFISTLEDLQQEETLAQVVNRIQQHNPLMDSFTYQANQQAPCTGIRFPAAHSSFYLPEVSAVSSEDVVQGSPLPVFAVMLVLAEGG